MLHFLTIYVPFILITKTTSHIPKNDSSVIIYGGHADADREFIPIARRGPTTVPSTKITAIPVKITKGMPVEEQKEEFAVEHDDGQWLEEVLPAVPVMVTNGIPEVEREIQFPVQHDDGQVIFVPTQAYAERNIDQDFLHDDTMNLDEVLHGKKGVNLRDIAQTTTSKSGIVFIHGKNEEVTEAPKKKKNNGQHADVDAETGTKKPIKLDCKNLDCNNYVKSICGVKNDNGHLKYRLFLNECYYRKVNCAFSYESYRYKIVPLDKCSSIGSHYTPPSMYQQPQPVYLPPNRPLRNLEKSEEVVKENKELETRRLMSGRKSMLLNTDGRYCSHTCPTSCTDDYQPECAMNVSFERRVFLNHCKLDLNSCTYGMIWRRRPLSECVGVKKADLQQNRAFIGWMQRVGIVDKKGRLVLN